MIIDLSHPLSSSVAVCPGHPQFSRESIATLDTDPFNVHALSMGSHTGTHIDAPFHFFEKGLKVDQLNLKDLVAPAIVVDVRGKNPRSQITWEDDLLPYAPQFREGVIVLLCTGWSKYWGQSVYTDHPFLTVGAARTLVERGIKVIGTDSLSPDVFPMNDKDEANFDAHRVLLGAGGVIAENLTNLEALLALSVAETLPPIVSLLPLKLAGLDGSPIRAVGWPQQRKMDLQKGQQTLPVK